MIGTEFTWPVWNGRPVALCIAHAELRTRLFVTGKVEDSGLEIGTRVTVEGTARQGENGLEVWNPLYHFEADHDRR